MIPKQEANEIKTKVLIKIRGNELNTPEKMYMIKISKPNVCLADVKNHLNSNLNLYFSDVSNMEKVNPFIGIHLHLVRLKLTFFEIFSQVAVLKFEKTPLRLLLIVHCSHSKKLISTFFFSF